jgi:HEAT repeat protein
LIKLLLNDDDESVRSAAATSLGNLQSQEAVKPMLKALKEDSSINVKSTVLNYLSYFKGQEVYDAILACVNDRNLQITAIYALQNPAITGQ